MEPIQLIIALISAAERAAALARNLSQVKMNAADQNRELTIDEVRGFQQQAHAALKQLDELVKEAEEKERGG